MPINKLLKVTEIESETHSPAKALEYAYIIAFALIALCSVGVHYTTDLLIKQLNESSEVTYELTNLRTLFHRLPEQVTQFKEYGSEVDQYRLISTLKKIDSSRNHIIRKLTKNKDFSPVLFEVFFDKKFDLNAKLQSYALYANECGVADIRTQDIAKVCGVAELVMSRSKPQELLASFDIALNKYRAENTDKIELYKYAQFIGIVVIISVLILEAFLIFRPLIKRIHKFHALLVEQALQDPMTGLKNRRAFMSQSTAEISQASRTNKPIAAVLMDLDNFKSVNDTYGHDVGDAVIKHFAQQLKKHVRRGDLLGRVGGEEFAIMLVRSTNDEDAFNVINRIRMSVEKTPCPYKDKNGKPQTLPYTVSSGVYSLVPSGESVDKLLSRADEMLYEAKEKGRNKVVLVNLDGRTFES